MTQTPKQEFTTPRKLALKWVDGHHAHFTQVDGRGELFVQITREDWEKRGAPLTIEAMLP